MGLRNSVGDEFALRKSGVLGSPAKVDIMISRRPIYSAVIGVILAVGALFAIFHLRGTPSALVGKSLETRTVLVAARDIPFGTKLTPNMFRESAWPTDSVPAEVIVSRDELAASPKGQRIAVRSLVAGEPLLRAKVSEFGEKPRLSRQVPVAMRAYSVRVSEVSGVSGFPLPGDRVDVLLTRISPNGQLAAEVVLQNLTVLGVNQTSSEDTDQPIVAKTATIQVTPEQAQVLALAEQSGILSLALRNYADTDKPRISKLVLDNSPAVAVAAAPSVGASPSTTRRSATRPNRPEVIVRRGTVVSVEPVSAQ